MIEHTFDAGPVAINYVAEGREDGRPLVFLHGVSGRWQTWLPVMTAFAAGWRLYALDFRGHGRSGRAPGAYRAVDYAADVVAFLRRRVEQPAVLVGHSLGAIVAVAVAADAPEAVRAVVLETPPLGVFDEQDFTVRPERPGFRASARPRRPPACERGLRRPAAERGPAPTPPLSAPARSLSASWTRTS